MFQTVCNSGMALVCQPYLVVKLVLSFVFLLAMKRTLATVMRKRGAIAEVCPPLPCIKDWLCLNLLPLWRSAPFVLVVHIIQEKKDLQKYSLTS